MLQGKDWEFSQNAVYYQGLFKIITVLSEVLPCDTSRPRCSISLRGSTPLSLAKANEQPSLICDRLCFYFLSRPGGMSVSWQSYMELQTTSWSVCITLDSAGPDQTAPSSAFSLGTGCCKLKTPAPRYWKLPNSGGMSVEGSTTCLQIYPCINPNNKAILQMSVSLVCQVKTCRWSQN